MKLKKIKIRTKFNLLMITVIFCIAVIIGVVTKNQIEGSMSDVYEEQVVAVDSKLGLKIIDERFPGDWNIKNGELYKGNVKINGNNETFDEIGEVTGGLSNIFMGNATVATNIVVDGKRTIGADANKEIAEAVLERGEIYTGHADISGKLYLTIYEPLKDSNGKAIGMYLVGSPIDAINSTVNSIILAIIITLAIAGCIGIMITFLLTKSVVRPISVVNQQLHEIAEGEGDLTKEIHVQTKDEIGDMAAAFNTMMSSLRAMLGQVSATSQQVATSSEILSANSEQSTAATNQIVLSIQEVANTVEVQGKNTKESAEAINEITSGIQHVANSINLVADRANETMNQAINGNEYIQEVVGQMTNIYEASAETIGVMNSLETRSQEIEKIIDVITNIAGQTNLLALNAAIEAARAGEHGKGFAVVANEVRKLAEQSNESAKQIVNNIKLIQDDITTAVNMTSQGNVVAKHGLEVAQESGKSFGQILESIQSVSSQTQELSAISEQMSASIEQVNASIEEIARLAATSTNHTTEIAATTEEQLATMQEVASSAAQLASMAEQLQVLVNRFKI